MLDQTVTGSDGPRLLGRQRELTAIKEALRRHGAGAATTLWVRGEAGIGKTRLLDELRARADARGHLVLAGRGAEFERDIPFGVWIDALDDYAGSLGFDRLERLVGDRVEELGWVLPSVHAPTGATMPALPEERYRAHRAVRALLDAMARQRPVVIALDDLQWADGASIELAAHLLRRPSRAPVLLALAFRSGQVPVELSAALEAATRDGPAVGLAPAPLSAHEAEAMLGALDPAARAEAFRQSGGNPFYLEELTRLAVRGRAATAPPPDALGGTPQAVATALAQEIAALSGAARGLAQGAAVAGEPVELDEAVAAAGLEGPAAMAALDELLETDLLRPTEVPRRYRFRHPIVRRAVYEAAGESWRLDGHARVAAALEARGAALTDRAHHLERCAQPGDETAIAVLAEAAHAVSARAPASAARWLESALRLLPATETGESRHLELLVPLAIAQAAEGRLEEALGTLQEVLERLPPELAELRSRLVAACAAGENLLGRHAVAHARLVRELAALGDLSPAAAGVLQVELAVDALFESDFAAVQAWAARAGASARASDDAALGAVATALECFAHYSAGETQPAERCRAEAAARLDALTDQQLAGRLEAPYYLGFAEFFCERYDDAARHLRRGIAVARATGQGQYLVPMMILLAHASETAGHVREGVEMAETAVDAARLAANPQVLAWALTAQAWTAVVAGERDRAVAACEEAVSLLDGLDPSVLTDAIHTTVGAAWLEAGETERGLRQLDAGGAPDFALVEAGRRAWLYSHLASAELARGRPEPAGRWLARGEATLSGLELPMAESALPLRDEAARELRRLGHRVTARQRRARRCRARRAQRARARDRRSRRPGPDEPRDRRGALPVGQDGRRPSHHNVFAKLGVRTRAEVAEAVGRERREA